MSAVRFAFNKILKKAKTNIRPENLNPAARSSSTLLRRVLRFHILSMGMCVCVYACHRFIQMTRVRNANGPHFLRAINEMQPAPVYVVRAASSYPHLHRTFIGLNRRLRFPYAMFSQVETCNIKSSTLFIFQRP